MKDMVQLHTKRAIVGGVIATIAIMIGSLIINVASGSEARILLQSMLPSVRFLCSAVMTASATILALMLTMLSMSNSQEVTLKASYYERIQQTAFVDTIVFVSSILILLFISIPLSESQDVPGNWYTMLYYTTLTITALLGGGLIVVVMMLYNAIIGLIHVVHPEHESHFAEDMQDPEEIE